MKKLFVLLAMALATCNLFAKSDFVQVKDGHFVRDGKPYYYVGTNFWYGAILGSEGQGGNRERLCRELDKMKEMGIDNLRILVGSDGKRGVKTKVEPTLQEAPGVYNDTILAGLDYLLMEMENARWWLCSISTIPGNGAAVTAIIWSRQVWARRHVLMRMAIRHS